MNSNFDLAALALRGAYPNNDILYDDQGMPSFMVRVPKATYAELGLGESTDIFPAFIVNGTTVPEIYVSKYQNCVINNRAYSLGGVAPRTSVTFDQAFTYCQNKGAGWHVMTTLEWAAVMLWCEMNGFIPIGNNNYGKHGSESFYTAIPATFESDGRRQKILTGTGPETYFHDKTRGGIADLCGNVWEWVGGVRTVYGELQILVNNNAADVSKSQGASSGEWKAINAATGALVTPDGNGTTEGSVKMDWISSKLTYSTTITDTGRGNHNCTFASVVFGESIGEAAQLLIQTLGFAPKASNVLCASHQVYFNNAEAERLFFRGGTYYNTAGGLASFNGNYARSTSNGYIGFRSAFVKL